MKRIIGFALFFHIALGICLGQFTREWTYVFQDPIIAQQHIGNTVMFHDTIIVQGLYDFDGITLYPMIMKINKDGELLWHKEILDYPNYDYSKGYMTVDTVGNIYAANNYWDSDSKIILIKMDSRGNIIWTKSLPEAGECLVDKIAIDPNNSIILTGSTFIAKLDLDGNILWSNSSGGNRLLVDKNGEIYVSDSENMKKIDSDGNLLWTYGLADGWDVCNQLYLDNEENLVFSSPGNALTKITSDGNELWVKYISGDILESVTLSSFSLDKSGNVFLCGTNINNNVTTDLFAMKIDSEGNVCWTSKYDAENNNTNEFAHFNIQDDAGFTIVFGESSGGEYYENLLVVFDTDGNQICDTLFNEGDIHYNCNAILKSDNQALFITGITGYPESDIWISKYQPFKDPTNPEYYFFESDTICDGDTLLWQENYYFTEGTYSADYLTQQLQDSTYELALTVMPSPETFTLTGQIEVLQFSVHTYSSPFNEEVEYQWSVINGNTLSYPSGNSIEVQWEQSTQGIVKCVAINAGECPSDTAALTVNASHTMVPGFSSAEIKIYPVPADEYCFIDIGNGYEDSRLNIIVYNQLGVAIFTDEFESQQYILKDSDLNAAGLFYVHIIDEQLGIIGKGIIILQRYN